MTDLATPALADALTPAPESAPVETTQVETPATAGAEASAEPAAAQENAGDADQHRDPKTGRFARRVEQFQSQISQLRAEKGHAERELADLQRRAADLRKQVETPAQVDPNDFDAVERARLNSVLKSNRLEETNASIADAESRVQQAQVATYTAKLDAARERIPTLDQEVAAFNRLPISREAADEIIESQRAADIVVWLARNPAEAMRIASLPRHRHAAAIARIELQELTKAQPKRISQAPAPLQTASGSAAQASVDPTTLSLDDYEKWRVSTGMRA